jgi:hypothetical protein
VLEARDPRRPRDPARFLVERDELAVELADVDLPVAKSYTAARPSAANGRDLLIQIRAISPLAHAGLRIDGVHVVRAGDDVDDVLVDERLRLSGVLAFHARAQMDVPEAPQPGDIPPVDLSER